MAANMKKGSGRWGFVVWSGAACLLLLPLVAMQFTRDVNWTLLDFAVFGTMLLCACSAYELGARMSHNTAYRAAVGVAAVAAFFLVWINLAVGIIGSEHDRANLMFAGVLTVGIIGALIVRFQPRGMARVLVAMAITQALVGGIALAAFTAEPGVIAGLTGVFVALWLASAWLFARSASMTAAI